jgi:hypothetical protein
MEKQALNDFRWYSMARMHMLLNNETAAMQALTDAVKNGFPYRNVLDTDELWRPVRGGDRWKQVMDGLPPAIDYGAGVMPQISDPIQYIIPGFVKLYK